MRIEGYWKTREVLINGRPLLPEASLKVVNHSPDGFNWGYAGSGPAQLALAILLRAGLRPALAERLHQRFKAEHIQHLPQDDFLIVIDVDAWALEAMRGTHSGPVGDVL
jgi:hypothetical protein